MRAFFELVRWPLTPTAVADSLVGFFIARSLLGDEALPWWPPLLLVTASSIVAYWAGMASNDVFDVAKDRRSAPDRPLVTGSLHARTATLVIAILFGLGGCLAALLDAVFVFGVLVAAILIYNGGGKRVPVLGNLLMGSCRSLNVLLGAVAAPGVTTSAALSSAPLVTAAAVTGVYIAAVTAISLLEDRPYRRGTLRAFTAALLVFPIGLAIAGWSVPGAWINALLLTALLARELRLPRELADAQSSHPAEQVVRGGLRALYLVDAGLAWCFALWGPALAAWGLLALGWFCMRLWLQSRARS